MTSLSPGRGQTSLKVGQTSLRKGQTSVSSLRKGVRFSLDAFMASQSDGLYFDVTETDRFFQENLGPTLASSVADPIGLALSQRAWNGETLAELLAMQPELCPNGDFSSGNINGWTLGQVSGSAAQSYQSGALRFSGVSNGDRTSLQLVGTISGRRYRVTFNILSSGSPNLRVGLHVNAGAVDGSNDRAADGKGSVGTRTTYVIAPANDAYLQFQTQAGGAASWDIDNISVKEVPGKHGSQTTGTLKPTRQTTGAKFDGSDDNWLTSYMAGAGANFVVALVTVPTSMLAAHLLFGASNAGNRFYIGFDNAGKLCGGVGNDGTAQIVAPTTDFRGQEAVVGLSCDGTIVKLFADGSELLSHAQNGAPTATTACRLGAQNSAGTATSFFGGSIKKLAAGRQFLDLDTYLKIRTALLAA